MSIYLPQMAWKLKGQGQYFFILSVWGGMPPNSDRIDILKSCHDHQSLVHVSDGPECWNIFSRDRKHNANPDFVAILQ